MNGIGRRRHGALGIDQSLEPADLLAITRKRTAPISTIRSVSAINPVVSRSRATYSRSERSSSVMEIPRRGVFEISVPGLPRPQNVGASDLSLSYFGTHTEATAKTAKTQPPYFGLVQIPCFAGNTRSVYE